MTRTIALASFFLFALPGCAVFRPEPRFIPVGGAYSQGIVYDGLLFTAGFTPRDPKTGTVVQGDITVQTNRVMDSLEAVLEGAGCTLKDVVKLNVYLVDFADFAKMNAVMEARFGDHKPARTTVPIAKSPGPALLEVDLIAQRRRQ